MNAALLNKGDERSRFGLPIIKANALAASQHLQRLAVQFAASRQSEFADLKHIIIATDGSELAGKAGAEGIQLARVLGARVTFLTVTSPFASLGDQDTAFAGLPEAVRHQALAYLNADADRTLSAAVSAAKAAGVNADSMKVESRQPHEAIIATAKLSGADLILMASHGRSGIKAVLLGSVTQKVLTHSEAPVLVVR